MKANKVEGPKRGRKEAKSKPKSKPYCNGSDADISSERPQNAGLGDESAAVEVVVPPKERKQRPRPRMVIRQGVTGEGEGQEQFTERDLGSLARGGGHVRVQLSGLGVPDRAAVAQVDGSWIDVDMQGAMTRMAIVEEDAWQTSDDYGTGPCSGHYVSVGPEMSGGCARGPTQVPDVTLGFVQGTSEVVETAQGFTHRGRQVPIHHAVAAHPVAYSRPLIRPPSTRPPSRGQSRPPSRGQSRMGSATLYDMSTATGGVVHTGYTHVAPLTVPRTRGRSLSLEPQPYADMHGQYVQSPLLNRPSHAMAVYGAPSTSLQAETGTSNVGYAGVNRQRYKMVANRHVPERRAHVTSPTMYLTTTPATIHQAVTSAMYPAPPALYPSEGSYQRHRPWDAREQNQGYEYRAGQGGQRIPPVHEEGYEYEYK
ncbi:hypothetical protein M422DRAFT_259495 [Sphaerobolus stellatus SS14]|uniref:Uncharacterized protein n=1 Tax=Sphaerobolus stellatus (strain SS14) TaxID=990650 RepID=A0A0C9V8P8_SPHS4|nr:hypothetical protein M422DRAFT_259495 [Sphaerobolus stellatus SS14]